MNFATNLRLKIDYKNDDSFKKLDLKEIKIIVQNIDAENIK